VPAGPGAAPSLVLFEPHASAAPDLSSHVRSKRCRNFLPSFGAGPRSD
jgi:hypothetical protein